MSRLSTKLVREILEESGSDFSGTDSFADPEYHPEPKDFDPDSDVDNEPLSVVLSTLKSDGKQKTLVETPINHSLCSSDGEPEMRNGRKDKLMTRWRKRDPENWQRNIAKRQRQGCLPYFNENAKKEMPAKTPKAVRCSERNCAHKCQTSFSFEERLDICKTFWKLDYLRQKDFILSNVKVSEPKRRLMSAGRSRSFSRSYHLSRNATKQRVCQHFFEKTLCISNGPINTAVTGRNKSGLFDVEDKRGKRAPKNKHSEIIMSHVKRHIESFPTMESHYCRKTTLKRYLDKKLSILKMYELYKSYCTEKHIQNIVSQSCYRRYFCENYNYSFFKPKKDQCAICSKFDQAEDKRSLTAMYDAHIKRKDECNSEKAKDKALAQSDSSFVTATFDLQSVLQIPCSDVSQFYYSRKICVYNLTIYEGASGNAFCFMWNEMNGKRGSSEIGTILLEWLNSLPNHIKTVSTFSDTCAGQNRNKNVAALLLYAVCNSSHIDVIEQKFLESGHTFMECDSMHSAIENEGKRREIFGMSGWRSIMENARSMKGKTIKKDQYRVKEMRYNNFYDLQALSNELIQNRLKDEHGEKVSWLKIKSLRFEKESPDIIFYRYDHHSPYTKIHVAARRRRTADTVQGLRRLYKGLLPISKDKQKDLWKLCQLGVIPEEFHGWYDKLPVGRGVEADKLPESYSAEEEEEEDEENLQT